MGPLSSVIDPIGKARLMDTNVTLIVVDVQNDFLPGGALGVTDGFDVIDPIINFSRYARRVALTSDWHPADHCSFSDDPKFVDKSWPPHCVQGTPGAQLDSTIERFFEGSPLFLKGTDADTEEYSGFNGKTADGKSLPDWLAEDESANELIVVAGLALDYCVRWTALDAVYDGYETAVLIDGTRPVSYVTAIESAADLSEAGAIVIGTDHLTKIL